MDGEPELQALPSEKSTGQKSLNNLHADHRCVNDV